MLVITDEVEQKKNGTREGEGKSESKDEKGLGYKKTEVDGLRRWTLQDRVTLNTWPIDKSTANHSSWVDITAIPKLSTYSIA